MMNEKTTPKILRIFGDPGMRNEELRLFFAHTGKKLPKIFLPHYIFVRTVCGRIVMRPYGYRIPAAVS